MAASRAFGALVLMAVLVVGVPYLLLAVVGNPLPGEVPSIDEVRILLTQNGEGFARFIIGTLAVLIWIIWAQLMAALVVEIAATVGHTETRRLRTAPGIQSFAARLIATITLATTLAALPGLAPAVGALTFSDVVSTAVPTTIVLDTPTTGMASTAPRESSAGLLAHVQHVDVVTSLVVHDHTELWDLADAAYGDGVSWKLIALANAGLSDANGQMITNESETVAAGTALILPGVIDRTATAAFGLLASNETEGATLTPTASISVAAEMTHTVEVGDSMWTVAESEVERRLDRTASNPEVADYWVDVVDANQAIRSGDADLIYPGERLVLPGTTATHASAPADPNHEQDVASTALDFELAVPEDLTIAAAQAGRADEIVSAASEALAAVSAVEAVAAPSHPEIGDRPDAPAQEMAHTPVERRASSDRTTSLPAAGLAALGAGILSAGVVGAVRRRRDLQRRTRPSGAIARAPSTEAAAFEAALIHASGELLESRNGLGWRVLPAATVNAMRTGAATPVAPPEAEPSRSSTVIDQPAMLVPRRIDTEDPVATPNDEIVIESVPTSIVVGTDPDTNEAVFIDLASAGAVALIGDAAAVRRFARSVVLDLAVSDRADDLCVIAVGTGAELHDLERVRVVASFPDALTQAVRCGHATTDSATPVIVVSEVAARGSDEAAQALRDLGAIVVAPGLNTPVTVTLEAETATIAPSGTTVALAALDDDAYLSVAELIESTSGAAVELADISVAVEEVIDVAATSDCVVGEGPIDVKILGPVEITGAESFSSLKAVDVVTYLAFHRHGVDADQIKTWVWPTFEPPTDKAFANVMSRARTGLGADSNASPYLSRAGSDKTYRLADAVTTDFDRFRAIVELADDATETTTTLGLLSQALELIRGIPFTGGAASSFAWADNHVRARVEYTIDETVHRCADLALELDDLGTARWAALKGLELVPGCEQCFKRRFLVAGAGNNRSELRRAMADLEASAMADLGEPEAVDAISGELLDLYHELDRALVAGSAGARP